MAKHSNPQMENQLDIIQNQPEGEINFLELFYHLLSKVRIIIAAALIGAILMGAYSFFLAKPTYQATSKLYVLASQDSAINLSDLQIGSTLTKDYLEVFNTWEVQAMVVNNLGLDYGYTQVRKMIEIECPEATRMLYITATSYSAQEAADLANEFAAVAQQYITEIMLTDQPSIMSQARVPSKPVSPNKPLNVIKGFLAGFVLACVILAIRFFMDDKIKSGDDIRKYTDMNVLAIVPVNGMEKIPAKLQKAAAAAAANSEKKEGNLQ